MISALYLQENSVQNFKDQIQTKTDQDQIQTKKNSNVSLKIFSVETFCPSA